MVGNGGGGDEGRNSRCWSSLGVTGDQTLLRSLIEEAFVEINERCSRNLVLVVRCHDPRWLDADGRVSDILTGRE